ncbi:MAG: hypothetical protein ACKOWG_02940 [Planctomycetia bacterium]
MTTPATTSTAPLPAAAPGAGWFGRIAGLSSVLAIATGIQAAPPAEFVATPSAPSVVRDSAAGAVQRIDDYAAAKEAARQTRAMLLVSVEPTTGSPADLVGQHLEDPQVQERFATSGTPWVFCRIGMEADGAGLAGDPALVEMRRGAGLFVIDYAHDEFAGRIVSILPRTPGKYYRFSPAHVDELASLPAGTLTQRSLILAVRLHPEHPQSTQGSCDPQLCRDAAAHSSYQARIRRQGHHDWQTRSQRIAGGRGGAAEVCAESWENQDLLDSCVDCVASWRQSPGHWTAVQSPQAAYGYDIRRGSNGIWYATGIFVKER